MMIQRDNFIALWILFVFFIEVMSQAAQADDLYELKSELRNLRETVKELTTTVAKQQQVIDQLTVKKSSTVVESKKSVQLDPVKATGTPSRTSIPFIPEIGVVADITGLLSESKEGEEGNDRISVRELELVLGHDIDPYSRLDATIAFSDFEQPDIEEAYVSYWDLPWGIKARLGRLRPKIGKASPLHRDSLDTVDEPFVIQRYFGAEGLSRTGLELSGFTPFSSDSYTQQLTGGIMEGGVGEDATLFGEARRQPSLYAHLSNFLEITDTSNFEIGGTYLLGSQDDDYAHKVNAFGIDATLIHYFNPINRFKFQSEGYFQNRDESILQDQSGEITNFNKHTWGFYALADYKLSERWGIGSRYDYVEPIDDSPTNIRDQEVAISGILTFYQSEFARWRLQYEYAKLAERDNDNRFFLQGTFAIGTHKHQLQ